MIRFLRRFGLFVIVCQAYPVSAQPVIAESRFSSGDEGWTAVSVVVHGGPDYCPDFATASAAQLDYISSGGDSGGFIEIPELDHITTYFRAPSSFHGDLSAAAGGSITYSRRFTETVGDSYYHSYEMVHIVGSAGTLVGNVPRTADGMWETRRIEFMRGFWLLGSCRGPVASEADIAAVLADVTDIYFRGEHSTGIDVNDLDSVVIRGPGSFEPPTATWSLADNATPTARWRHAMAVDSDRNVLVLFGGNTGETDTWEFDLATSTWSQRHTDTAPSRRGGHAMVYDPFIHRMVLTGGDYLDERSDEVWEYDGVAGVWEQAPSLPQARKGHAMAYDSQRQTIVLYGGVDAGQPGATDVIERSGPSGLWTPRPTNLVEMGPQFGHSMAFDSVRNVTVLVDSRSASTGIIGVYEWDGNVGSWTPRAFSTGPEPRLNPCITFDSSRGKTVLVAGEEHRVTWDYDGTTWTARASIQQNNAGKDEHAIAYDSLNHRILSYGGFVNRGAPSRYLTAFDGAANTWSFLTTSSTPSPRYLAPIAYDEATGRTIMYGGHLVRRLTYVNQIGSGTFAFDGQTWTSLSPAEPEGNPGARFDAALAYDPISSSMYMYSGLATDNGGNPVRDVWALALNPLTWHDLTPPLTTPPGQRRRYASAFDRHRQQLVVFGGLSDSGVRLGDTWTYTPATGVWAQVAGEVEGPGAIADAAMVFDERRQVCVLFGGRGGSTGEQYSDATWEWDGAVWRDVTTAFPRPAGRRAPSFVYDATRQVSVLFGGNFHFADGGARAYGDAPQCEDMWQYDGRRWTPMRQLGDQLPIARWLSNATFDRGRNRLVSFGGASVAEEDYTSGQTWLAELSGTTCVVDVNADGNIDFFDLQVFLNAYSARDPLADWNSDGLYDFFDVQGFLNNYSAGCP